VIGSAALLIAGVVGVTSVGSYLIAVRWGGLSARRLGMAARAVCHCLGVMAIFCVVNLLLGATLIIAVRLITGRFVSLYLLEDVTWWALSALQGLTWSMWRQTRR
jgi:hypothetical protein